MKTKTLIILICFLGNITLALEYTETDLFVLSWGWDNDQQIPYAKDYLGGVFGPYNQYVDASGNIYFAFPYEDFRKYNSSGEIIFRKSLNVSRFAVDDSSYIYFTLLDLDKLNLLNIIDNTGMLLDKKYEFSKDNVKQDISWIKNQNGMIIIGNSKSSAQIYNDKLDIINYEKRNPKNSKGYYFNTETSRRKTLSTRRKSKSFNENYINLIRSVYTDGELKEKDIIKLDICRFNHTCGELLAIDNTDKFYFEIFYREDLPRDIALVDSTMKAIYRIELIPLSETMGLDAKPFIRPDGTIYEFRDLDDGLHVIRWSRKE